tara:strand:- start:45 stop:620 length:576 start_codon:yes stop_codon:yes gene_type:complete
VFTGIIKNIGTVEQINLKNNFLSIKSDFKEVSQGESISCSGICLTVNEIKNKTFKVNVSLETIKKTNLHQLEVGKIINLERSLSVGDELGGHLVFGHVDDVVRVVQIKNSNDSRVIKIEAKKEIMKFITSKCSVALDGISLTVNDVHEKHFFVNVIPYTWDNTSLKDLQNGDLLNLEIDMIARYVFKALKK